MRYYKEHIGVFSLTGNDVFDFLQRVSTYDFRGIGDAGVVRSVLVNGKGRIVDFVTVLKCNGYVLLASSKGNELKVKDFFEKYIVADDVNFTFEILERTTLLPEFENTYEYLSGSNFIEGNYLYFDDFRFKKIMALEYNSESEFLKLMKENSEQITDEDFKNYAIDNMYVYDVNELNEEINPLECGLTEFISFNKGCYIGQEVISRLDTQGKIPKLMVKVVSDFEMRAGDKIYFKDLGTETECGFLTSAGKSNNSFIALGFIKGIDLNENYNYYINKNNNNTILINK